MIERLGEIELEEVGLRTKKLGDLVRAAGLLLLPIFLLLLIFVLLLASLLLLLLTF